MMASQRIEKHIDLNSLLKGLVDRTIAEQIIVTGLALDSRQVEKGDLFLACSGTKQHGITYIPDAVHAGAVAVLVELDHEIDLPRYDIPIISLPNLISKIGEIAHRFYDKPSEDLDIIGVTGTNGKTSTAWYLAHALTNEQEKAGFIGTLGSGFVASLEDSINTTPDAITVHKKLAEFRDAGTKKVIMEVSSHALEQFRIASVVFQSIIFTNLSRDHLDYHETMQAYANSKRKLFTDYQSNNQILNIDDKFGNELFRRDDPLTQIYGYSLKQGYGDKQNIIGAHLNNKDGYVQLNIQSPWGSGNLQTKLIGQFNAYNLLAVFSALCLAGFSFAETIKRLEKVKSVPGRMECFTKPDKALCVVDYAHTPDALASVLSSLKQVCHGKLICVFGCGGDRDRGKRSQMGEIASRFSDHIILTNDNPRFEDPANIIEDIQSGITGEKTYEVEQDRAKAIQMAMQQSQVGDIVLVAGKGHETTQQISNKKIPFSDREWIKHYLESYL